MSTSIIESRSFSSLPTASINSPSTTSTTTSSSSKVLENDTFENIFEKATLDQSFIAEKDKANLVPLDLWTQSVKDITVVDAKESGIEPENVRRIIDAISAKELADTKGTFYPSSYVKDEYFNVSSRTNGFLNTEAILLSINANKVVGFIITHASSESYIMNWNIPKNTSFVAYIAVDSDAKRSGVGTKLMLAAMHKTKQLGNQYLALEYIGAGLGVNKKIAATRIDFYNSFTKRFGITKKTGATYFSSRQLHVFPYYDLKNIDFNGIVGTISPTKSKSIICNHFPNRIAPRKSNWHIFSCRAFGVASTIILCLGLILIKRPC